MSHTLPPEAKTLQEIVTDGHKYFWLLDFNTRDWVLARFSSDGRIIRLDTESWYHLEQIKNCPTMPITKPERVR